MLVFKVSKGLVKKTNQLLVNSNKLSSVFYNIGNKFVLTNSKDMEKVDKILSRNYIKLYKI